MLAEVLGPLPLLTSLFQYILFIIYNLSQHFLIKQIKYISIVNIVYAIFTAIFLSISGHSSSTVTACWDAGKTIPSTGTFTTRWFLVVVLQLFRTTFNIKGGAGLIRVLIGWRPFSFSFAPNPIR